MSYVRFYIVFSWILYYSIFGVKYNFERLCFILEMPCMPPKPLGFVHHEATVGCSTRNLEQPSREQRVPEVEIWKCFSSSLCEVNILAVILSCFHLEDVGNDAVN